MVLPLDFGVMIPEDEPVRLLDALLEELNYTKLHQLYSSKGRKSAIPPRIIFKLYIFAMTEGIYSTRQIQRQCQVNLQYKWLLEGYPVPSHMAFQRFFARLTLPITKDLFSQLISKIAALDSITFDEVFIDGTKFEANANRYTFVWRKSVERRLASLPAKLAKLQKEAAKILHVDTSFYADDLLAFQLKAYIDACEIKIVHGIGKRKHPVQRLWEAVCEWRDRRLRYEANLAIMNGRNSYSKTDPDATFMRMKEDHMRNGQLKPAYNVQIAAHSEYILGVGIFPNPTDTKTLIPFMKELEGLYKQKFRTVVADAGYGGEENLAWLYKHNYSTCIKPYTYEKSKTRKWKNDIGRAENMTYCEATDTFTCATGHELTYLFQRKNMTDTGFIRQSRVYGCSSCEGCLRRKECQKPVLGRYSKTGKRLYISPIYNTLLSKNMETFKSSQGIQLRINRSIQVEGIFGVLKQDYGFKRFLHKGAEKVHKELMLLAMGFNLQKLHNRNIKGRIGLRLFDEKGSA